MGLLVRALFEVLASIVAPGRCAACDDTVKLGRAFCPPCAATIVRAENPHPDRTAAFVYGGAVAQAIRRFKFDGRPDLAPALLAGLHPRLDALRRDPVDLVVPVPLHPARLVERGYNQAALLGRPLARWLQAPFAARALTRRALTARQTDLTREARAANVASAFAAARDADLRGKAVLLVDDVETTGATLAGCGRALLEAGACEVRTVVVARAEAPSATGQPSG
jgi:ComF family protein